MKKAYETPKAEKFEFEYEDNVTASASTGLRNWDTAAKTDNSNPWWTCENRFADAAASCGQDGHENSNPWWYCNNK